MSNFNFGLIGHNIGYSKSADIFMSIFDHIGVAGSFENYDWSPENFERRFAELAGTGDVSGLAVTIPYKQAVISHLDDLDPVAKALEAVNSIAFREGRLIGFNTDRDGFARSLDHYRQRLERSQAAVLGCGGSARAVVYSLYADFGMDKVTVFGRSREKLSKFAESMRDVVHTQRLETVLIQDLAESQTNDYTLIVNCTPLGGWNQPEATPFPRGFAWPAGNIYYDLNYNRDNRVVREAGGHGMTVMDGSGMLIGQALRSFEIWTGRTVPFEPIHRAVFGE